MYRVKRAIVWLYRWKHCRGFGVQSPTDYQFVRYVINEHAPYYAYDDLKRQFPDQSKDERKFCQLLLRIANYRQAHACVCVGLNSGVLEPYIHAGCNHTKVYSLNHWGQTVKGVADMVCCMLPKDADADLEWLFGMVNEQSVAVVKGIRRTRAARRMWKSILNHPMVTISYDLFDCGIIFFDGKRYQQNYIINF